MKELEKEQVNPLLHRDSQSIIDLANNLVYHNRTKFINVQYYFICIHLKDDVWSLKKMHKSQNPADMLTKVITVEKLKTCVQLLWVFKAEDLEVSCIKFTMSRELVEQKREVECRCCVNNQSLSRKLLSYGAKLLS